jgi:hypothetical protein
VHDALNDKHFMALMHVIACVYCRQTQLCRHPAGTDDHGCVVGASLLAQHVLHSLPNVLTQSALLSLRLTRLAAPA